MVGLIEMSVCTAITAAETLVADPELYDIPAYKRECRVPDCSTPVGRKGAKGLCSRHYQKFLLTGSPTGTLRPTQETRFFRFVEQHGECWEWTGSLDGDGYGMFSANGRSIRAHIWAYRFLIGDIPPGLHLDHLCRNRRCVNPWDLDPVTIAVNLHRGLHGVLCTACPRGHPYDEVNTYNTPAGRRVCRTCMKSHRARYESKKKAAK